MLPMLDWCRLRKGAGEGVFAAAIVLAAVSGFDGRAQLLGKEVSAVEPGDLPRQWLPAGPRCMEVQPWQVHEYNPEFLILRQSGCTDYEKPFVFLVFGKDHVLLFDTGSRMGEIVPVLRRTLHSYMERHKLSDLDLYVVHSHAHEDHIWGDKDIQAWSDAKTDPSIHVKLIPATVEASKSFYGLTSWPDQTGTVDLGGRVLDAIPIPGHETAGMALYDRQTGVLLTGDSVYPGRLYIADLDAFTKSNERLIHFTEGKPVSHILGNHIEEKRIAFEDYPVTTIFQPEEHVLELPRGVLYEIRDGLERMKGTPQREYFADFTLWPSGAGSRPSAEERERIKRYEEHQISHKWDQSQP